MTNRGGPDVLSELPFLLSGERQPAVGVAGVLARCVGGPDFPGFAELTHEQQGPWRRFLVRCAARALRVSGLSLSDAVHADPAALRDTLERALRDSAPSGAWLLHQPDSRLAGFLQPPTPNGLPAGESNNYRLDSPALLTTAIGAKLHERKPGVTRELTCEQAVYALVEYQTGAIYGGKGNYPSQLLGSASGAGSGTPYMGVVIHGSLVESFRHDVGVLMDNGSLAGHIWALWAEPWDGVTQIPATNLDPAFIPFARMVRFGAMDRNGRISVVWFRATESARVRDHTDGGMLGDPFTPSVPNPKTSAPKVRGTLRKGYDYTEIVRLLFGTDEQGGSPSTTVHALAYRDDLGAGDLEVVFEGTAYEQGKTGGFHSRRMLLPASDGAAALLALFQEPDPVRTVHRVMLDRAKKAKSALRGAARILLAGGPSPREGDAGKVEAAAALLEQRIDQAYLSYLFSAARTVASGDDDRWIDPWCDWLSDEAMVVWRLAEGSVPRSTNTRWQRGVGAESYLRRKLAQLREAVPPDLSEVRNTEQDTEPDEEEVA